MCPYHHVSPTSYQPEWKECLDNGDEFLGTTRICKTITTTYNYVLSTFVLICSSDSGETSENTNKNTSWEKPNYNSNWHSKYSNICW